MCRMISGSTNLQSYKTTASSLQLLQFTHIPKNSSRYPKTQPNFHQTQTTTPALHTSTAIMARGGAQQTMVHYKGKDEDFIVFVDDVKAAKDWKTDKSIPLAQVVSAFKVFVTHK